MKKIYVTPETTVENMAIVTEALCDSSRTVVIPGGGEGGSDGGGDVTVIDDNWEGDMPEPESKRRNIW